MSSKLKIAIHSYLTTKNQERTATSKEIASGIGDSRGHLRCVKKVQDRDPLAAMRGRR